MLFVFPPLQRRIGTGSLLRICAIAWPISFCSMPLMNALLRTVRVHLHASVGITTDSRQGHPTAFWVLAPFVIFFGSSIAMIYGERGLVEPPLIIDNWSLQLAYNSH